MAFFESLKKFFQRMLLPQLVFVQKTLVLHVFLSVTRVLFDQFGVLLLTHVDPIVKVSCENNLTTLLLLNKLLSYSHQSSIPILHFFLSRSQMAVDELQQTPHYNHNTADCALCTHATKSPCFQFIHPVDSALFSEFFENQNCRMQPSHCLPS